MTTSIRWFCTNRALATVTSNFEVMLKDRVHNPTDTERWFNDIRHIFFYVNGFLVTLDFQHVGCQDVGIGTDLKNIFSVVFQRFFHFSDSWRFQLRERFHNFFGFLLERFANNAFVGYSLNDVDSLGLAQLPFSNQADPGGFGVLGQVVGRSIGTADTFNPSLDIIKNIKSILFKLNHRQRAYIGSETFSIPTIAGVVSHFVVHMLTESKFPGIHSDFDHVLLDTSHEICQSFISNDFVIHCLADSDNFSCFAIHLVAGGIQEYLCNKVGLFHKLEIVINSVTYLNISNFTKFRMRLVRWIAEMFNFCHRKLTNADQARARRNFIAEAIANLSCCEGQFFLKKFVRLLTEQWAKSIKINYYLIEFQQSLKVNKDSLCCFRSQEAFN